MFSRLRHAFVCSVIALAAFVAAPAHAALDPYDVPVINCEGSTLASITLHVCGGAVTGAPAGLSIHWKKLSDFQATGWADDGTLCALSLSGQPSMQHPGKSRWELLPGECEDITIGDINFDETGVSGTGCGLEPLECGTQYVFRWFAHAGRGFGRSDWGGEITCATAACPNQRCTYTQGYWKNHGGPAGCNQAPVNAPDPYWCKTIISNGLDLGNLHYSAAQLCQILNTPAGGKGLIALAHQLIAAQLNLCNGATSCADLQAAIASANAAIGNVDLVKLATGDCTGKPENRPPGCGSGVPSANVDLTAYNEGGLCNPNCHGSSVETGAAPDATSETRKGSWGTLKSHYR